MTIQRSVISRATMLLLVSLALAIGVNAQSVPEPPSGLGASITGTTVTLLWHTSAIGGPVQSHIIEVGSVPGASDVGRFHTGPTTSIVATNVAPGTLYVRVRGVNNLGISGPSNEVAVTVGSVCVSVPTAPGPLVSAVSGSSVQLSWGKSSGSVSTYVFEIGSVAGTSNLGTLELGSSATTYASAGVAPGTYFVRVKARNPCGLSAPSNDTVVVVGGPPSSGPPQLRLVNEHSFVIESGPYAGQLIVAGEVLNTGGSAASMVLVGSTVFSPGGSRLRGFVTELVGRSRRLTNSQRIENWTLGPGETGCFVHSLGAANTIGRYEVQLQFEDFPTAALQGQLRATATWDGFTYATHIPKRLRVFPTLTNVGTTPTAWNTVAFVAKDSSGRVLSCGAKRVYGRTNRDVPGYGVTNVLLPGETADWSSNQLNQPLETDFVNFASIASVSVWPQWKE